jgi:hypothetical protein
MVRKPCGVFMSHTEYDPGFQKKLQWIIIFIDEPLLCSGLSKPELLRISHTKNNRHT